MVATHELKKHECHTNGYDEAFVSNFSNQFDFQTEIYSAIFWDGNIIVLFNRSIGSQKTERDQEREALSLVEF